jgi:hypothetical protein
MTDHQDLFRKKFPLYDPEIHHLLSASFWMKRKDQELAMRLLIVAMPESIHTARWISRIADQGWDIHLFPSIETGNVHEDMRGVTVHSSFRGKRPHHASVRNKGIPAFSDAAALAGCAALDRFFPRRRSAKLKKLVDRLRPDIIHSMEMQAAGYLTMEARKSSGRFPPWIVSNWGSDIFIFGRLAEHEPKIRELLSSCDYYTCECNRDVDLAHRFGLKGKVLSVLPNAGGFDIDAISGLRESRPSVRRLIMLKGYQGWAGRSLVGLRALERCADMLKGYEVVIYLASPEVVIAAELFQRSTGVNVRIIPKGTSHVEILSLHGRARLSIGLSIGDAASTSMLEAMAMGSFPIQSWTSCADEWIEDGKSGLLVPPDDPEVVEKAIRKALADDALVDGAAELNYAVVGKRLNYYALKPMTVNIYNTVASEKGII